MWRAAIRNSSAYLASRHEVSIPRTVCGGLQLYLPALDTRYMTVSIPRTVCGGLQSHLAQKKVFSPRCFNTENGMWRAAIFPEEAEESASRRFNTENGMWRAAIWTLCNATPVDGEFQYRERYVEGCNLLSFLIIICLSVVSIPRTVCGGLQ